MIVSDEHMKMLLAGEAMEQKGSRQIGTHASALILCQCVGSWWFCMGLHPANSRLQALLATRIQDILCLAG